MITYTRVQAHGGERIKKVDAKGRPVFVKSDRVPPTVMEQFEKFTSVDAIEYNEHPELSRCLFCEGYKQHSRIFAGVTIALCGFHYYDKNIGQIAAELRKQQERQTNGILLEKPKARRKKRKSVLSKTKK